MRDNRNTPNYGNSRGNSSRRPVSGSSASQRAAMLRKRKRRRGLRIGNFVLRGSHLVGLLAVVLIISIVVGLSVKPPECYSIDYGSITMYETVDGLLIKDETGYSYPEGVTLVSRVPDGTYVNAGDPIAVVRTAEFISDWYHLLNLARAETLAYMMKHISPESPVLETVKIIDKTIQTVSDEMLKEIVHSPEKYAEYSAQLTDLYIQKRTVLLNEFAGHGALDDYIATEEQRQAQIDNNTLTITALRSGIVSYNTDGYANIYNYEKIDTVTETVFDNILNGEVTTEIKNSRALCDYYISDMNSCYITMKGNGNTFKYLQDNDETIIRVNSDSLQHMATVKDITESTGYNYIVVEPVGDYSSLYRERAVSVTLQKTWAGLVVPKEYIVRKGEKQGVEVYENGEKTFVPVDILAENESVIVLNTESANNIFKKGTQIVVQ